MLTEAVEVWKLVKHVSPQIYVLQQLLCWMWTV